jgi:hypothetical protein
MIAEIQIITFDTRPQTPSSKPNKKITPTVRLRWKVSTSGDRHQVPWYDCGIYDILKGL